MGLYIVLMGVQGAGKGVQARYISEKYNIPHVSTGDLFRAMKTREDDLARKIQEIMSSGQLVSDEITNEVVRDRLEQDDAANGAILDGFPRNRVQAEWLGEYLRGRGEKVEPVLLFELDLYTAFRRAFGRVSSPVTGKTYNIYSDNEGIEWNFVEHPENAYPPRLEATEIATGASLTRRPDDANAGAIIKRIDTYLETTAPLIAYYEEQGTLVRVDASRSIEDVQADVARVIDEVQG